MFAPPAYRKTIGIWAMQVLLASFLLIATTDRAGAAFTGLLTIPTADTVPRGQYGAEFQINGMLGTRTIDARFINTQFGLAPSVEAGLDLDVSDESAGRALLNVKCLIVPPNGRHPSIAAGLYNVGPGLRSSGYVVVTQPIGVLRGHGGLIGVSGRSRWFLGIDAAITKQVTLVGDFVSGSDNFASVGMSLAVGKQYCVVAGVLIPHERDDPAQFNLHLCFSGSYHGHGRTRE